jgi:6-phosphogluconolactonase
VRIYKYNLEMRVYKYSRDDQVAEILAKEISFHLNKGEKVLWLIAGGSVVNVAATVSEKLKSATLENLTVTLTDERYVPLGDSDSNWRQLVDAGFKLQDANLVQVLNNEALDQTTKEFDSNLRRAFAQADYKIALFGMGEDGHIAALFPGSAQLNENNKYAVNLNNSPKPPKERITMTFEAIKNLSEAIIFTKGSNKLPAIEKLKQNLNINEQPAQFLKNLSKLTLFNDQIGESL